MFVIYRAQPLLSFLSPIDLACARRKISLKGFALSPDVTSQSVIPGAIYHGDKSVSTRRNFITFPMLLSKDAPSSRMYRMIRAVSGGHRVSSRTPRSLPGSLGSLPDSFSQREFTNSPRPRSFSFSCASLRPRVGERRREGRVG